MSKYNEIRQNYNDLDWWRDTVVPYPRLALIRKLSGFFYPDYKDGIDYMKEDWDNLIILDACRFDLFDEAGFFSDRLESKICSASGTPEFLKYNFKNKQLNDTIYVTANPMYQTIELGDPFFKIVDVWEQNWNDTHQTVLPEHMAEATLDAYDEYPNKRIVSHFMQPHYPFLGEARKLIGEHAGSEYTYQKVKTGKGDRESATVWEMLEDGNVSKQSVWRGYLENLSLAIPHVISLIEQFETKTIVTSDHGNLIGESPVPFLGPVYGHPVGVRHKKLCKIPWIVFDGQFRKEIQKSHRRSSNNEISPNVSQKLKELGYHL